MPFVSIEVRKQYSQEQEIALLKAVHSAIYTAFKKPDDINVRFIAHEAHRFPAPVTKTQPELYTNIIIDCIEGRSIETKRLLYRSIVENLIEFEIPQDHIKILLRETKRENWGIRGGLAACDVEFDYEVEV